MTLPKPHDLGRKAEGPLRQAGLRLPGRGGRLSLPGRRDADLPLHERGRRPGAASLLDHRMPDLRHQDRCTTGKERRITRWEHEHILEAVQRRLDANPEAMRQRRETVEHPFGTIKARMGATHFLMKTLKERDGAARLAYNLTREHPGRTADDGCGRSRWPYGRLRRPLAPPRWPTTLWAPKSG